MIYLFDRAKKLQKIIPRKHIINAIQTKVRNGIYQLAVEAPIFYETKQGTHYNYQKSVSKAEFAGHYDDKNRFQLYKIYSRNITANEQGEFLLFDGVHIFFDEAKAMGNIHDRRFRDSEAKAPADVAFNSIGWTVIDYDVTDRHNINFYRASVTEAWNDLISTYGVEFDYELQFDGRKIISKNIIMKKQIGQWTGQRFAYGTNVLTLTQEQDESEVFTAAVGRGRGEESGDGFGPRLEFGDIAWSKDGIAKPIGQNYIELPSATAEYGFIEDGVVKPRIAPEVIFENIEDKIKLADATYYWLLENCLPKATWKTEVARIGNLNLGDTVGVLYKAAGIIKRARVEKIEYNLLDPELSKLTLGDFHHFENRQMKRINAEIKRLGRDNRSLISQAKNEFNQWFNDWVTAFENQFAQAKIDIFAEIEADRENMQNLLDTKSAEWTDDFNQSVAESKEYAEQQAEEKASAVQGNLDSFKDSHQQLYEEVTGNILDIDTFLGDKSKTLSKQFAEMESGLNQSITAESGRIDAIVTNFGESGKSLAQFVLDIDSIEKTVVKNDDWLGTHGSNLLQTVEGFEQKVWMSDVANINPNLIPFADVANKDNVNRWETWNGASRWIDNLGWYNVDGFASNTSSVLGIQSSGFEIVEGRTYTLSVKVRTSDLWNTTHFFRYTYLMRNSGNNTFLGSASSDTVIDSTRRLKTWTFTADRTEKVYVMFGTYKVQNGLYTRFSFSEPKLEEGTERTLFMNAFSNIEQKANELSLKVAELSSADGEDFLTQSDITVQADRVRIGSVSIGSTDMASILSVSPSAIDMITDKLNLTGNLNVKGQIESLAVSAVRGDIAYLKTNILTANSITSEHLSVSTAMVHKLFAASARIDELITKSHFVNNVKAMSIEAVEGQFSSLMTKYFSANYIDVDYINGKNAWFESQYTLNANIAKLTAQTAFIRDIQAIEITANQLNIQTLHSKLKSVEGGLTIYGPDGRVLINNSMLRASFDVQVYDAYGGNNVEFAGLNYYTSSSFWQTFKYFYTDFKGSQLLVSWAVGLQSGNSASEYAEVQVRGFGGNNPIGSRSSRQFVKPGETTYHNQIINLGVPDYSTIQGYLEFRRSPTGVSMNNTVYARVLRVSLIN